MTTTARHADRLLDAVRAGVEIYDLGRLLSIGMPQSPNHPPFWLTMPRRHGDMVRADGGSAANDLLVMGTHVGTHVDALAHVSHDGLLHGGADAAAAQSGGRFTELGVHTVAPMVRRGVLPSVGPTARPATRSPRPTWTPPSTGRAPPWSPATWC
ncbi:cyclase family protein [Micromonospora sp. DH15]|nr:cyclase family protein [Micromonospora sp. DH15]